MIRDTDKVNEHRHWIVKLQKDDFILKRGINQPLLFLPADSEPSLFITQYLATATHVIIVPPANASISLVGIGTGGYKVVAVHPWTIKHNRTSAVSQEQLKQGEVYKNLGQKPSQVKSHFISSLVNSEANARGQSVWMEVLVSLAWKPQENSCRAKAECGTHLHNEAVRLE